MSNPLLRARSSFNRFSFFLRSRFSWGRRYRERGAGALPGPAALRELGERYGLDAFAGKLSARSLLLNLSTLHRLEELFRARAAALPFRPLRVLDVGSQNFVYAPALSLFFSRWGTLRPRAIELTGIEIDVHRRYRTLHTRRDLARYYASLVPSAVYLAGDFLSHPFERRFDVVTWFRPHLDPEPLVWAGLPLRLLRPEEGFRRALDLLEPGGVWALSCQSEEEARIAEEILGRLGAKRGPPLSWEPPEGAPEGKPQRLQLAFGAS